MKLRRVGAIVLRQFYLMRASPTRLVPAFAWSAIDIVLWGFITRYLATLSDAGPALALGLLGAVLLWNFFGRIMHGVTTAFFEDIWARNLLNLFATPLAISEYVTGLVLTSLATGAISLAVMLALATGVFGLSFFAYGLAFVPFLLVLLLFGVGLGILASAIVLRLGPASEWLIWPIPALLSPFAAVFYPLSILPAWMQWVAHLLPPAYVFEGMRAILAGQPFPAQTLAWALGLAVLEVLAAYAFFVHIHRRAVRSGLLARYSAESVS
ncbi:ABC transporter permease [Dokdonella koreensis]|uniref:Transport permease protein n=1 Tax=Dokdonella koreensis DS-123 TaxID=1300342 RepID=A0A160DXZ2_9GAMM|nr:ABC transporter permease [Dokdonella koreensis]ANB19270.1 ABC-type multidrug transport system, permease component [Dokdonella koreensis DS-123]